MLASIGVSSQIVSQLSFVCFLMYPRTCSSELAEYKRLVLYSRLPAQFFSLSLDANPNKGEITGLANIAAKSLIKDRLFMAAFKRYLHCVLESPLLWF